MHKTLLLLCAVALTLGTINLASAANMNGRAGSMPAFYDGKLFTINFKELPPSGEQSVLQQNKSINIIYMDEAGLPGGQPFIAVINAIQGEGPGFNPLWREVKITFNPGVTPHQFTSDSDVTAAAAAHQITLTPTNEVYRCAVIGPGK